MNFGKLFRKNSGTICALTAVIGVFTTAYFSGKAAVRVDHEIDPDMDKKLKAKTYVKAYWKAAVSGIVTSGLIIASDRIHVRSEVALAGIAAMYKDNLKKINNKIEEKYGKEAVDDIYREIVSEEHDPGAIGMDLDKEASGKKLYFYEPISGQCIETTYQKVLEALLESNFRLQRDFIADFPVFIEWIGGEVTTDILTHVWDYEDEMQNYNASFCGGFTIDFTERVNQLIEYWVNSDKEMVPSDRITMDFLIPPVPEGEWDSKIGAKTYLYKEEKEKIELPWD